MTRQVRLTDAERQEMVDELRRHLADGRLTMDEFEERAATVYRARLQSEADGAFDELPRAPQSGGQRRRGRRHGEADQPKPYWRETAEVFRDPSTGRVMRVYVDPADGSRHYVPN